MGDISKDLSRIISTTMKKQFEKTNKEKKIRDSIEQIKRAIERAEFEKEKMLITTDNLYLAAKSIINSGKGLEGLRLLVISLFGYFIVGDSEKIKEVTSQINELSQKLEKELLSWGEFDKAFLIRLIPTLLVYINKEKYEEPESPDYLKNVFPYLRDAHKVLALGLFNKIQKDFFEKRIERYQNYSEKKGLLNYWNFVWEVFNDLSKIKKMREAYIERMTFEKM